MAKFTHAYSKRLKYRCERLKGKEVFYVGIDWAIPTKEFSMFNKMFFDFSYCTNIVNILI